MPSVSSSGDPSNRHFENDWRELDFFHRVKGLSRTTDLIEAAMCYDLELVRECLPLIDRILAVPDRRQKGLDLVAREPYLARWSGNLEAGKVVENQETEPWIPTVCLLAPWFPEPWLAGCKAERARIVEELKLSYNPVRPLAIFSYPLEPDLENELLRAVEIDQQKGFGYRLFVVAVNTKEPFGRLVTQFKQNLTKLGVRPSPVKEHSRHRRLIHAAHALERLCCFRLSKLSTEERDLAATRIDFLKGGVLRSRLSKARRAVLKDFAARHYLLPSMGNS
jgi:hypothetical protein